MNKGNSNLLAEWDRLLEAVEVHAADLQWLEPFRAQLARALSNLRELSARRKALRLEMSQSAREIRALSDRGRGLAARLRAGVRAQYGHQSEELLEFGMKPLRSRKSAGRETP